MEGVVCKNQAGALRFGQAAFDEGQITFLVAAVNLVANDGMAEVGEVDAELVFATGAGDQAQQRKRGWRIKPARGDARPTNGGNKPALDKKIRLRGRAIGADAILDGDAAVLVPAERPSNIFPSSPAVWEFFAIKTTPPVSRSRRLTRKGRGPKTEG